MEHLNNREAEAGVICAALHTQKVQTELARYLTPEDFYHPAHEAIWTTIRAMLNADALVDPITIMSGLAKHGYQNFQSTVVEIVTMGTVDVQAMSYAQEIRELATRRTLSVTGARIQQLASTPEETPKNLVALALTELETAYRPVENQNSHVGDLMDAFLDDLEDTSAPQGLAWPYEDAARVLKPLAPGQFAIVAGRPAMGKSVCLADIARSTAIKQGKTTVVFSLEMSAEEYLQRIIAAEAKVTLNRLHDKNLNEQEWARIAEASDRVRNAPLHIIDDPECTLADIRAGVKNLNADIAMMDYIQLGTFNPKTGRREGLEEFSRGLKITAKKSEIPFIAAAQLNRGSQDQKKPRMSDLRESGALEQDADVIVLVHRDDYEEPEHPRAGEVDLIVAKQRKGPTGLITLAHQFAYARFADMHR